MHTPVNKGIYIYTHIKGKHSYIHPLTKKRNACTYTEIHANILILPFALTAKNIIDVKCMNSHEKKFDNRELAQQTSEVRGLWKRSA